MPNLANCALTAVTNSPGTGGLSLTVASSVTLPTVPFKAIVTAAGEASKQTNSEIINVTAASTSGGTTTLTIERAAEGPMAARNITSGDQFYAWITVGVLDALGNINNANGAISVPWKQATCTVWEGSTALETTSTAGLEAGMPLEGNWVGPNAAVDEIVSATLVKMTRPADHGFGRTPCVTTNGSNEVTVGEPSGTEGLHVGWACVGPASRSIPRSPKSKPEIRSCFRTTRPPPLQRSL